MHSRPHFLIISAVLSTAISFLASSDVKAGYETFRHWVLNCDEDFVTAVRDCALTTTDDGGRTALVRVGTDPVAKVFGISITDLRGITLDPDKLPVKAFLRVDREELVTITERVIFVDVIVALAGYTAGEDLSQLPHHRKYLKALASAGSPEELKLKSNREEFDLLSVYREVLADLGAAITETGVFVSGQSAEGLLEQFRVGTLFRVRLVNDDDTETDLTFSLLGFSAAFAAYSKATTE